VQQEYANAIDIYGIMLTNNPTDAQTYRARGFAFQLSGKYQSALSDYTSALDLAPDAATAWACVAMRQTILREGKKPQVGDAELAGLFERAGFESLLAGDFENARRGFQSCENRYPQYHSVNEVLHLIQNPRIDWADPEQRRQIFQAIVSNYSYHLPPGLLDRLKAAAQDSKPTSLK